MKSAIAILLFSALLGCTGTYQGRTTEMNPDCTQVSAEEQAKGNCMYRPEVPEGMYQPRSGTDWVQWRFIVGAAPSPYPR